MLNTDTVANSAGSAGTDEVVSVIAAFFKQTSPGALAGAFTAETPLLESGLLDSLSMLQLTTHLSDTFGVEFDDDDFTLENFATAGQISSLIAAKSSRSG
jgi:acyl carrier protein